MSLTRRRATAFCLAVAALCTVPTLGRQPLSWDEATTLRAARLPYGQLALLLRHTDAPLGLYYALIHAWLSAVRVVGIGPSEAVLRLPSVLAVFGSVVLLVRLADAWFDPVVADVLSHLLGGVGFVIVVVAAVIVLLRRRASPSVPPFLWVWAVAPPVGLVAADFVTPDLVARYGLVMIPALVLIVALVVRAAPRIGLALAGAGVAAALAATVVQQIAPYKYENYRSAAEYVGDSAEPGAAIVFLPVSMRDGYRPYVDNDGVSVSDPLLAAASVQTRDPRLGGDERSVTQATAPLRRASEIFLFGYTISRAERSLTSPADVAKLRLLLAFRVLRVVHYGGVWVSVLHQAHEVVSADDYHRGRGPAGRDRQPGSALGEIDVHDRDATVAIM